MNILQAPCEEAEQAARGIIGRNGEAVLTENGRPVVLMLDISDDNPDYIIDAVYQARGQKAIEEMRAMAEAHGWMTDEEIEAEIAAYRREKREREQRESRN